MSQDYLDKLIEKDKAGTQIQSIPLHDTELRGITIDDPITVEGNPINFSTKNEQNAIQTVVDLEPIQDLHGYSKPWVGGAGKNLIPMTVEGIKALNTGGTWNNNTYTFRGVTYKILTDADNNVIGINVNGAPSENTTLNLEFIGINGTNYILNGCPSNGSTSTYFLDTFGTGLNRVVDVGSGVSFQSVGNSQYVRIGVMTGATVSNLTFYPMLRLSTVTDSSFEPYTNICPILSHEEIKIEGCGKNFVDYNTKGDYDVTGTGTIRIGFKPVWLNPGTYTASFKSKDPNNMAIYVTNITNNYSYTEINSSTKYATFTLTEKSLIMIRTSQPAGYASTTYVEELQLEKGETKTSYEPYQESNNLSIDLPEDVYGGTLNLETGELVVDRVKLTNFDTANITEGVDGDSNWLNIWFGFSLDLGILGSNSLTERNIHIQKDRSNYSGLWNFANITNQIHYYNTGIRVAAFYPKSIFPTLASFIAYEVKNRAEFILALATPYTIQLTPAQLKLFKDVNNLNSSDYTTLTVTYHSNSIATLAPATDTTDGLLSAMDKHKFNTYDIADIGSDEGVTVEDNPLMITTRSDQHALSAKVNLAPIQDLHGYSKPWIGGAGKNILKMTVQGIKAAYIPVSGSWSGNTFTSDNLKFTLITDPDDNITAIKYEITGTLSEQKYIYLDTFSGLSGNYLLSGGVSQNIYVTLMINNSWSGKYSRNPSSDTELTINSSSDTIVAAISVGANISGSGYFYPMLRLSTKPDPTFEPYTNICSISGLDEIDILGCGKNLIPDGTDTNNGYINNSYLTADGSILSTGINYISEYFKVKSNSKYVLFDKNHIANASSICFYDINKNYITGVAIEKITKQITTPENAIYARCTQFNDSTSFIQFESGSIAHECEPYKQSNNLSLSLPETVYGGELDLESGELRVDKKIIADMSTLTWQRITTNVFKATYSGIKYCGDAETANILCEIYAPGNYQGLPNGTIAVRRDNEFWVRDSTSNDDSTTFINTIIGQKLVYELATPTTIHLTPSQLTLFKDINYISTNAKSISVTYREGKLAINSPATDTKDGLLSAIDKRALDRTEEIVEGNPIQFETESTQVAKSTIIDLEPIQDLHGFDKPWVGGAGKNILPLLLDDIKTVNTRGTWTNNVYTLNGVTWNILTDTDNNITGIQSNGSTTGTSDDSTLTIPFTDIPVGNYYFSGCPDGGNIGNYNIYIWNSTTMSRAKQWDGVTNVVNCNNASQYAQVKVSDITQDVKMVLRVDVNGTINNSIFKPMVCASTATNPAQFEPYTNICPISGRSEIGILGCGKNLMESVGDSTTDKGIVFKKNADNSWDVSGTNDNTGVTGVCIGEVNIISGQTYILSGCPTGGDSTNGYRLDLRSAPTALYNNLYDIGNGKTFTATETITLYAYIRVAKNYAISGTKTFYPMIRKSTDSADYTQYAESTNLTISLGQTVYGGTLDVENGVLVVDRTCVTLTNFNGFAYQATNHFKALYIRFTAFASAIPMPNVKKELLEKAKFDIFRTVLSGTDQAFGNASIYSNNDGALYFWNNDDRFADGDEFKAYLNEQHVQMCYYIATPTTISLTPEQVKLLQGVNTITTNADNITLTYRNGSVATLNDLESLYAKLKAYIDSLHSS